MQGDVKSVTSSSTCPQLEPASGDDVRPLDALDGEVLAERAGNDRVSLRLERPDPLQREQTDRAVGAAVTLTVAVGIALDARGSDLGGRHRVLGNSTR